MAVVMWWLPWVATVALAVTATVVLVRAARQPAWPWPGEEEAPAETTLPASPRSPVEVLAEERARAAARAQELKLSRLAGREDGGNTAGRAAPFIGHRTAGTAERRRKGSGRKPAGTGRTSGR